MGVVTRTSYDSRPGPSHLSPENSLHGREFTTPPTFSAINVASYLLSPSIAAFAFPSSTLATVVRVVSIKSRFFFIPK
jgi:hypothetical protein